MLSQNTETFLSLGDAPDKVSEDALIVIEMFENRGQKVGHLAKIYRFSPLFC